MFNCLRCKDTGWKPTRPHYEEVDGKKIKALSMIRCACDKKVKPPKLKREELRMLAAWNEAAREINNANL